jgi:hypothetical protein
MMDIEVYVASYKFCSFERSPVICEYPSGYAEPVYDTLQELDRCFLHDVYHWHNLHPLGECVNHDE